LFKGKIRFDNLSFTIPSTGDITPPFFGILLQFKRQILRTKNPRKGSFSYRFYKSFYRVVFFLVGVLSAFSTHAIDTLTIKNDFKTADIQDFGWLYLEEKHELNFKKIRDLSDEVFEPLEKTGISFSATKHVYWVKFYVKNESDEVQNLILEVQNPRINQIQLFFENEQKTADSLKLCGDDFPFSERIIKHRYFLFPIEVLPNEIKTVYVFADKFAENIRLLMRLNDRLFFYEMDQRETFFWATYMGFLIFFCVLMLIALIIFRKRILFYFFSYSLFIVLNIFAWMGYGFQYIWSNFPYFHNICGSFFIILSSLSLLALTRVYLQTKKYFKLADSMMKYIQYGLGGFLIYLFFYRQFSETVGFIVVNMGQLFQIAYMLVILIVPILSYQKRGEKDHLIFLGGFLFVFFGTIIHLFENLDWVDSNFISTNFLIFGFGVDLLVMMYIIGKQIQKTFFQNLEFVNEVNKLKFEAASALIEGQQKERQRLSLDLHDGISLQLATLKMRLSQILPNLGQSKDKETLKKLLHEIGKISHRVRNFTHALASLDLTESTLVEAVEDTIYTVEQADQNLKITCNFNSFEEEKLTNIQAQVLFLTIQELLNNIIKHAEATKVKLDLSTSNRYTKLRINDNGKGFDNIKKKSGIGLKNVQLRATFLNGSFIIESSEKGSQFEFSFPHTETSKSN
jgi:signal transduction histidine kinase